MNRTKYEYSEDLFAETRMTFGEHIEDLRGHLIRALKWLLLWTVVTLCFGRYILEFIKQPVVNALSDYHIAYMKKNQGKPNPVVLKLKAELAKDEVDPALHYLLQGRPIHASITKSAFDHLLRGTYPTLFQKGGPLAEVPPPPADESLHLPLRYRPIDFIDDFQDTVTFLAKRGELTSLSPTETFMVYVKVSLLAALVLASPWVFYEIWSFVAAGLYPHEKHVVYLSLGPSIFLFLGGVALAQFLVIPAALDALLGFNLWLNVEPDFRLNEWLSFAILLPVITGLCFQTPLVMFVLGKIGLATAEGLASKRKLAWLVMLFLVALGPTIDVPSLLLVWTPMIALYELGILLVRRTEKQRQAEDDEVPYQPELTANGDATYSETGRDQPS